MTVRRASLPLILLLLVGPTIVPCGGVDNDSDVTGRGRYICYTCWSDFDCNDPLNVKKFSVAVVGGCFCCLTFPADLVTRDCATSPEECDKFSRSERVQTCSGHLCNGAPLNSDVLWAWEAPARFAHFRSRFSWLSYAWQAITFQAKSDDDED